MPNPLSSLIGFIHRHAPRNPGRYVMPYLVAAVTLLVILDLALVADTRSEGQDTRELAESNARLSRRIAALTTQNADFSHALRDGLVVSCKQNGNTVRAILRGIISEEIEQSKSGVIAEFFPNIDPHVLAQALRKQRKTDEANLKRLHPIDCEARYPPPPSAPLTRIP